MRLAAGALLGVSVGDVYAILPAGSMAVEPTLLVATVKIDEVAALHSTARSISWRDGHASLPTDAVAIALSIALAPYAVRIEAPEAARAEIETKLMATGRLRAAHGDERGIAELRVTAGAIELCDELGPLAAAVPFPSRLDDAIRDLANLATVKRLRDVTDQGIPEQAVSVVVGVVSERAGFRQIRDGDPLGLRDRIAIRLHNTSTRSLWASVFNVGLRRTIARIDRTTTGIKLAAGDVYLLSSDETNQLVGLALGWPDGLPQDQPRIDTIMTIVTAQPADLSVLESSSARGAPRSVTTSLAALFDELAVTRARGRGAVSSLIPDELAIVWRTFLLCPIDVSLDLGAVEVDAGLVAQGTSAPAITEVALAAVECAAPTRIDALVCGRSGAYRATTLTSTGGVIWSGDDPGPLDVYLWTSEEDGDLRSLAELLALSPVPRAGRLAHASGLPRAAAAHAALVDLRADLAMAFRGAVVGASSVRYAARHASFTLAVA
ncbi:MAG: hypothetical protein WKG01_01605 [Kofleriaceae bacterium]